MIGSNYICARRGGIGVYGVRICGMEVCGVGADGIGL